MKAAIATLTLASLVVASGCADLKSFATRSRSPQQPAWAVKSPKPRSATDSVPSSPRMIAQHTEELPSTRAGTNRPLRGVPSDTARPAATSVASPAAVPASYPSTGTPHAIGRRSNDTVASLVAASKGPLPADADKLSAHPATFTARPSDALFAPPRDGAPAVPAPTLAHRQGAVSTVDLESLDELDVYAPQGRIQVRLTSGTAAAPSQTAPATTSAMPAATAPAATTKTSAAPAPLPVDAPAAQPLTSVLSMPSGDGRVGQVAVDDAADEAYVCDAPTRTAEPVAWIRIGAPQTDAGAKVSVEPAAKSESDTPHNDLRAPAAPASRRANVLRP